jgi:hypothetical protein
MQCLFEVKSVYGRNKVYPACDKSSLLAKLSGKTTLTNETLAIAKQLGYTFKQKEVLL